MKYDIVCSCGHEDTVVLFGPTKQREYRLQRLAEEPCCVCRAKMQDDENEANAAAAREMGLPGITGSEKQIAWAETLRAGFIKKIDILLNDANSDIIDKIMWYQEWVLRTRISASSWIDAREEYICQRNILAEYEKHYRPMVDSTLENKNQAILDAKIEATIRPEELKHDGVVEVAMGDNCIRAKYAKDDDFRGVVKKFGYVWDAESLAWKKKMDIKTGSTNERAAELVNALLLNGFAVLVYSTEVREMVAAGSWMPECKRWITYRPKDAEYAIDHEKNDALYQQSRRIKGAHWNEGARCVTVPRDNVTEVCDFAEINGFSFSQGAINAMDEVRKQIDLAKVVKGKEVIAHNRPDKLKEILNGSRDVLEDLKDAD